MSLPAPAGYNPTPNAAAAAIVREHITSGAIYLVKDLDQLNLPASAGFGVEIDLGTPKPKPSATASGAAHTSSTSPAPSPSPSPTATGAKARNVPSPAPSGPKIDTKVTIFPQDAPPPPSPEPTGDVQSYAQRVPIVRGYLFSQTTDVKLTSLGSVHFKLPKDERPDGRGFTVVAFEEHKHRKYNVIGWSPEATLEGDTVSVDDATAPLTLKKKVGYFFMLYGDDLEPTPVPRGAYPAQGNNPFATAQPSIRPGYSPPYYGPPTPYYGPPTPYGGQPPYGQPTYNPYPPR